MGKPNSTDSRTPSKKSRRAAGNALWNHALLMISISVVGMLTMAGLLWWQLVASSNEAHVSQQMTLVSNAYAAYFNGQIQEIRTRVDAIARADATVDAIISKDPARMERLSVALTAQHGYAKRIQIIPKDGAQKDNSGTVPISFAALDLILRAENEPFVGPEISLSQENVVFVAQPIEHDGLVRGVLFVAFDRKGLFFDPLTHMDGKLGEVKISQTIAGSGATDVFAFGEPGTDTQVIRTQLLVPHWTLEFTPNLTTLTPISSLTDLLTALAVMMGFFLAGIWFTFSSLARKLQKDADTLSSYISQLLRGRGPSLDRYQLTLFQQLATTVAQYGGDRKPAPARPAQSGSGDPADLLADDDDVEDTAPVDEADTGSKKETDDLLDNEDESFLEVNVADNAKENFGIEVSENVGPVEMGLKLSPDIFRAYDIRGVTTKNFTDDVVYWIGRAFAAEAQSLKRDRVAVGRDGRHSSQPLRDALTRGLTEGGVDVIDVGEVPTPLLYFATHVLDTGTGIMITGSHNPPDYNGLKMMIAGETLAEERIQAIRLRIEENRLTDGEGEIEEMDLNDHYLDRVLESVAVAQPCKVVVDCGNGVAGHLAPRLLKELGCEVVPLYCNVDGDFPNHHPDPADPNNLKDLIEVVKDEQAALGLAFDGDGDRLGVVTGSGEIIWPDKLLMLFAQDIVGRNPGADIIYDVKCSRHLNNLISEFGGRPIMWKTGHSHMKAKLKETGALLAGEFSGHICFAERWYGFDDALYSAARLLEIIGSENKSVDEIFSQFPVTYATPELKIHTTDRKKFEIMETLAENADFGDGTITDIDGVRVDYADGWGLVRASNTSPVLSLRFEADGQSALDRIQAVFAEQLAAIDPELKFANP
jgi:phosphomannomutase/phosphoglucomutase